MYIHPMGNRYVSEGRGPGEGGTVLPPVRVSRTEKQAVARAAKSAKLSMSQLVRARLGLEEDPDVVDRANKAVLGR